jgi:hypothetical protein
MAVVSMTEAARLSRTNRTTLWRKAKAGVLSTTTFPDGSPGIDTAELFRVFPPAISEYVPVQHDATVTERLQREVEHLHELLRHKDQVIETQAQALRLLEHKPDLHQGKPRRGFFSRMFGGRCD